MEYRHTYIPLIIAPFSYSLSISPSSYQITAGESYIFTVNVNPISAKPETVTLSLENLDNNVGSHSFTPPSGVPQFDSKLRLEMLENAPIGTRILKIVGTSEDNSDFTELD